MRPTESAKQNFEMAKFQATLAGSNTNKGGSSYRLFTIGMFHGIIGGLLEITVALRQTYVLLREVKQLLERQQR